MRNFVAGAMEFDCIEDIAYFAFWGLQGGKLQAGGHLVLPPAFNPWGVDIVKGHKEHFKADAVITHWDIWVVDSEFVKQAHPWIPYFPIDQYPIPPRVIARARECYQPVVYSKFALEATREIGIECAYVPHGIDCDIFKPMDKMECRRRLGFPEDAFIIGMVAANKGYPSRKAIPETLLAFEEFHRRHDDAVLYLHMYPKTHNAGVDVYAIIRSLNLPPGSVKLVDEYQYLLGLPDQYLADAYNSFNVLSAESMGEGCGLPVLESQACGTRVVTTNCSCHSEDTKALTLDGPRSIDQLAVGDWVWGLKDNQLLPTQIRRIIQEPYWGNMIQFSNCASDLCVTPNHRILYKKGHKRHQKEWEFKKASEFLDHADTTVFHVPTSGEWEGLKLPLNIPTSLFLDQAGLHANSKKILDPMPLDAFLQIVGWYIAEGCVCKDKTEQYNNIRFSNQNIEYQAEIANSLSALGLHPLIYDWGVKTYCIPLAEFLAARIGTSATEKCIPIELLKLDKPHLLELFTAMLKGDGSRRGHKKFTAYYTSSEHLKNDVVEIILKLGWSPSVLSRMSNSEIQGRAIRSLLPNYMISIRRLAKGTMRGKHVTMQAYQGQVWCLETEAGNFFIERNGRYTCAGNSMPENTFDGIVTEPVQRFWTQLDSWAVMPSVENMLEAWEWIYAGELGDPFEHSQKAIEGARKFDWPLVLENHWQPFLQSLEARIRGVGSAFYSSECGNRHRWAKVGLYDQGTLCVPCLRKWCPAELAILPGGRQVVRDTGFAMEKDGVILDIDDDPDGGVAKIIYREIGASYGIGDIPFEPGDVVLDLGAHVGVISVYIAKHHPEVTVYAFEPVPANFERLRRNIEANGVEGNVVCVNMAVTGDGRDLVLVGSLAENSGGATAFGPSAGRAGPAATGTGDRGKARIESMTLQEIFDEYVGPGRCTLLKIDVEGAEYEILQADPELLDKVDYLAAEFHTNNVLEAQECDPEALKELCAAHIEPGHLHISTLKMADRVDEDELTDLGA